MAQKKKTSKTYKRTPKKEAAKKQAPVVEKNELLRWIFGFLGVFIILTFFPSISNGVFGKAVVGFLTGLFGPMYYAVPFLMLIIVIFWTRDHASGSAKARYLLYALDFMFVSIIAELIIVGKEGMPFGQLWATGKTFDSAGIISGGVGEAFLYVFGIIASIILSIIGIFICTVLLFGKTPKDTLKAIIAYIREMINGAKELAEEDDEEEPKPAAPKKEEKKRPVEPEDLDVKTIPKTIEATSVFEEEKDGELPEDPLNSESDEDYMKDNPFEIPKGVPAGSIEAFGKPVAEVVKELENEIPEPAEEKTEREIPQDELLDDEDEEDLDLPPIEDTPYVFPPISLLNGDEDLSGKFSGADLERTSRKLEEVLASFNVKAKVISTSTGPTVTRYELQPETGVRVKQIANLSEDIALHLAAPAVRIENIPGKVAVGIEIPNKTVSTVRLRGLIDNAMFRDAKSRLYTALGEDVAGNPVYLDIAKMPHLLIAGATGMGKSVCINSIIISLLYRNHPNDVKLILIDPKQVEFVDYQDIPHLLVPVINEPKNAAGTLNWACNEMEKRYSLIQEVGARDLMGYNLMIQDDPERQLMPQIVIIIDELADLMMTAPDDVETSICRLAQKARAAGIHLVIGTQRPSVDVVTGLIKANIPSRIAFTVASQVDSRTILDMVGAEKLLGRGDMLYYPVGAMKPLRVQGAFVDAKSEVAPVTQFIKEAAHAQYDDAIMAQIEQEAKLCGMKGKKGAAAADAEEDDGSEKLDPMFYDAIEVAISEQTVSTSLLQRRLSLGYARAARIVDKLERRGYVSPIDPSTKKRQILITHEEFLELKLNGKKDGENE